MGQDFFRFKQFGIRQNLDVMRVNMDGVLLGAWAKTEKANRVLDVGTGTGVIALMLAQRGAQQVDAIDISAEAVRQATGNADHSPWSDRIQVHAAPLQLWAENCEHPYDLIVSNPPYFCRSLKSPKDVRNITRHTEALPQEELAESVALCLSKDGIFCAIFPMAEGAMFISKAIEFGLHCRRTLLLHSKPNSRPKRILCEFQQSAGELTENALTIYDSKGEYSSQYKALTQDFYLNF